MKKNNNAKSVNTVLINTLLQYSFKFILIFEKPLQIKKVIEMSIENKIVSCLLAEFVENIDT